MCWSYRIVGSAHLRQPLLFPTYNVEPSDGSLPAGCFFSDRIYSPAFEVHYCESTPNGS